MTSMRSRAGVAGVGALLAVAGATPALAATHPAQHSKRTVTITGVVTRSKAAGNNTQVKVLANTATVKGKVVAKTRTYTLVLHKHSRVAARAAAASLPPGTAITATVSDDGTTLTPADAGAITTKASPAEVRIGTVASVSGSLVTLATRDHVDGHECGQDDGRATVVDTSQATFHGPVSTAAALETGASVVILGEGEDHVMLASDVFTFTGTPALTTGRVTAVTPGTGQLTVAVRGEGRDEGDEDPGDQGGDHSGPMGSHDQGPGETEPADDQPSTPPVTVTVDASEADIIVNGTAQPGTGGAFPAVGDHVLAVGTASGTTLTASLVFDFNGHDKHRVGHNDD